MKLLVVVILAGMATVGSNVWQRSCMAQQVTNGTITATELRCEYADNPIGIDISQPRFSWILQSIQRGQMQSAYRILVATTVEKLNKNISDKWDSGKIGSEQSVNIPYQGKALSSGEKCFWKVRVWAGNGKTSGWSASAVFEMGLLNQSDWQGQWIGMGPDSNPKYTAGKFGKAVNLNGKNQSITIPMYPTLRPQNHLTISAWIKPTDNSSDARQYIYRRMIAEAETATERIILRLQRPGKSATSGLDSAPEARPQRIVYRLLRNLL